MKVTFFIMLSLNATLLADNSSEPIALTGTTAENLYKAITNEWNTDISLIKNGNSLELKAEAVFCSADVGKSTSTSKQSKRNRIKTIEMSESNFRCGYTPPSYREVELSGAGGEFLYKSLPDSLGRIYPDGKNLKSTSRVYCSANLQNNQPPIYNCNVYPR